MLISQRPTLSEEVVADDRSRFMIEPLEPGFGYTLGISLRRNFVFPQGQNRAKPWLPLYAFGE